MFIFWLLMSVTTIIPFYTLIEEGVSDMSYNIHLRISSATNTGLQFVYTTNIYDHLMITIYLFKSFYQYKFMLLLLLVVVVVVKVLIHSFTCMSLLYKTKLLLFQYTDDSFRFPLFCIYFATLLIELVLVCFVERYQRRGYQALGKVSFSSIFYLLHTTTLLWFC